MKRLAALTVAIACVAAALGRVSLAARSHDDSGEWRTYGADLANTRYKPFAQIDKTNFKDLQIAWRFRTDALGPRLEGNLEATPLMVGGIIYTTAGTRRDVVALDAKTGELLWMHREDEGKRGTAAPRQLSGRGLAYWSDGRSARVVYVTPGYRMIALDAATGVPVQGFGQNGVVDLKVNDDQQMDLVTGEIGLHATPIVVKDVILVGAAHMEGSAPKSMHNQKGFVRAFDVHTGKRLWIFHTIPMRGEFGYDTWQENSAEYTGNTGVWTQMSVDEELGLVYLPVEMPTGDYYGGHRPGNNLFDESLVAVDLRTGKRTWHFQTVHHGIWDYDLPCAPVLADVVIDGTPRKILAQASKQGWLYVLDRITGKPIWPIVERPVEQSDVPGEKTSATQPFVTKPQAFEHQGVSPDDLIDFTPELHAEALKIASRYKMGPLFTPPVVSRLAGPLGTLEIPNSTGGANWPGASYDPETHIIYIYSKKELGSLGLVPGATAHSDMAYVRGQATAEGGRPDVLAVEGLPMVKPPYGHITAIDLKTGDMVWQAAHGETPDEIRNHPALKGLNIPRTGRVGRIGTLTTKSLVIAGEGGTFTLPDGRRGAMLRAYDKMTGADAGAVYMPAPQTADDVHAGRQAVHRRPGERGGLRRRTHRISATIGAPNGRGHENRRISGASVAAELDTMVGFRHGSIDPDEEFRHSSGPLFRTVGYYLIQVVRGVLFRRNHDMKRYLVIGLVAAAAMIGTTATRAYAHHSFAATYLEDQTVTIEGDLVQFLFRNPHSFVHVMVKEPDGSMVRYAVEWGGAGQLGGQGVTRETLKPGDHVIITGAPGRNPADHRIRMISLYRPKDKFGWGQKPDQTFN